MPKNYLIENIDVNVASGPKVQNSIQFNTIQPNTNSNKLD